MAQSSGPSTDSTSNPKCSNAAPQSSIQSEDANPHFNLLIRGQLWHYCFCLAAAAAKLHSWAGMSLPFASRSKQVFKTRRHTHCPYASQTDVDAERFGATSSVMKINSLTSSKTAIPIPFVKSGRKLGDVWNLPLILCKSPNGIFLTGRLRTHVQKKLFSRGCYFLLVVFF